MGKTTEGAAPDAPAQREGRRPAGVRVVLFALMLALLLAMLDNTVVNTAMPTIVSDLNGLQHLAWVVTAYTLATAVSTPVWGKLGDLYGRKGAFLVSIALFVAGSALSGAAQDMGQLIAFRAVQGLGAGGLMVGAMAIIGDLVPPRERGKYQGMTASVMAVAMIGGPLVGGFITDHFGWRWTFYINVPLGIVAFAMIVAVLHLPRRQRPEARTDYLGAALLAVGITAIVLVTTWGGQQYAWSSPVIMELIALGVASLVGFVLVQRRAPEPVMPLHIFRSRNFSLTSLAAFITGFAMFGATLFLPLFQQTVQGASATNSGLLLLPMLLAMMVVSLVVGRITTRTGRYRIFPIVGGALMACGLYLLSTMGTDTSRLTSGLFMAVVGAGMGCLMQTTMLVAQNSVELKDMGVASSSATLFRTLGSSFGVAIMGALFNSRVQDEMVSRAGAAGAGATSQSAQLDAAGLAKLPAAVRDAYEHAVAAGTHSAFLLGAAVAVVAFAAAWFVKEVPLRGAAPDGAATEGAPSGGSPAEGAGAAVTGAPEPSGLAAGRVRASGASPIGGADGGVPVGSAAGQEAGPSRTA